MWVLDESYKQLYIKTKLIFECNYEHFKQKFGLFRGGVGSEIWVGQVGIRAKVTWQNMSASCKGDGGRGNDNEMNFLHP